MTPATVGASAPLPFKSTAATELPSPSEWLLAFLLCAALLAALIWLLRRRPGTWQAGRQQAQMKVLERQSLTAQVQLVVLQYGSRRLLLSVGPAGTQCLRDEIQDVPSTPASGGSVTPPSAREPQP